MVEAVRWLLNEVLKEQLYLTGAGELELVVWQLVWPLSVVSVEGRSLVLHANETK